MGYAQHSKISAMTQREAKTHSPTSLIEQRYRHLVDLCQDVIVCLSRDFTILSLNPSFERLTGWTHSEWLGKSILQLVHDRDRLVMTESLEPCDDRGKTLRV